MFIGAFLFSIVGIIGLSVELYSEAGRVFLFVVTLGVVVLVVTSLIRWIGQISAIGRVAYTIGAIENATREALDVMRDVPLLGGAPLNGEAAGEPVRAERPGYVQHVGMGDLQKLAEEHDLTVTIMARPGAYTTPVRPLLLVQGTADDDLQHKLRDCSWWAIAAPSTAIRVSALSFWAKPATRPCRRELTTQGRPFW